MLKCSAKKTIFECALCIASDSCLAGYYLTNEGCKACPENSFSKEGADKCDPCTVGHCSQSGDSICLPCFKTTLPFTESKTTIFHLPGVSTTPTPEQGKSI